MPQSYPPPLFLERMRQHYIYGLLQYQIFSSINRGWDMEVVALTGKFDEAGTSQLAASLRIGTPQIGHLKTHQYDGLNEWLSVIGGQMIYPVNGWILVLESTSPWVQRASFKPMLTKLKDWWSYVIIKVGEICVFEAIKKGFKALNRPLPIVQDRLRNESV